MRIGIVVDSTAYLTQEEKSKYQVELVPINVRFEGKVYRDGVDLTPEQAYQFLEKNPEDWATSAPAPGDFLAAYKKQIEKGAEEILCLTLPQKLSATWNSARMAKELLKKEMPEVKVEVIDSGTTATGETLLVKRLVQLIEEGKRFEELIKITEDLKQKVRLFLILETLRYIYRSGRIPELASKIGSLLPLKPILGIHQGKFHFVGATISKEKSKEKILGVLKEEIDSNFLEIGLMYIDNLEEAKKLQEKIVSFLPSAKIFISEFSPIVGYAMGRGTIGIGFFAK